MVTVFAFDSFDRADSSVLGTADTGQSWTATNWGISNNTARRGSSASQNALLTPDEPDSDYYVSVDIDPTTTGTGNQLCGPISRYTDTNNFILLERVLTGAEDAVKLYVRTGGVFNERGIWGGAPGSTGLDSEALLNLRIEHSGLDLVCLVNDIERISYTLLSGEDTALSCVTTAMREEGGSIPTFNDFTVESLVDTEPIELGSGSLYDRIMAGLVSQGFLEGSIADRERARLLAKLAIPDTTPGWSLYDLYREAEEDPRIF